MQLFSLVRIMELEFSEASPNRVMLLSARKIGFERDDGVTKKKMKMERG